MLNSRANCCILLDMLRANFWKASPAVAVPWAKSRNALLNSDFIALAVSFAPNWTSLYASSAL